MTSWKNCLLKLHGTNSRMYTMCMCVYVYVKMIWNKFAQVEHLPWHECVFVFGSMNRIEEFHFQSCFFCWTLDVRCFFFLFCISFYSFYFFIFFAFSTWSNCVCVRLDGCWYIPKRSYQMYKPYAFHDYRFAGWCSASGKMLSFVSCFTPYANKQISKQNKRHPAKCAYKHMNKQINKQTNTISFSQRFDLNFQFVNNSILFLYFFFSFLLISFVFFRVCF